MKLSAIKITVIMLPLVILASRVLAAQEKCELISGAEIFTEVIAPPNTNKLGLNDNDKAGWHAIHKHSLNRFIRGVSYKKTNVERCFRCHKEKKHKVFDAHAQLTRSGKIIKEKCLYCHTEKPDERHATFKDVKLIGDIKWLCERCHGTKNKHPARHNHFCKPTKVILQRMETIESKLDTILPLDKDRKITCITCHNPHQRGVIPVERAGAKGAGDKYRHRIPNVLCESCHGMLPEFIPYDLKTIASRLQYNIMKLHNISEKLKTIVDGNDKEKNLQGEFTKVLSVNIKSIRGINALLNYQAQLIKKVPKVKERAGKNYYNLKIEGINTAKKEIKSYLSYINHAYSNPEQKSIILTAGNPVKYLNSSLELLDKSIENLLSAREDI